MKVVIFDFCDTIVNFQTADKFVYYAIDNTENKKIKKRKKALGIIEKFGFLIRKIDKISNGKYSLNKRLILWQLRGASISEMNKWSENYYNNEIVPNLYVDMLECIRNYQKKGYSIYLVSGGYDVYLRLFSLDYNLNGCLCTKLKFIGGVFSGRIDGVDCTRENKIKMLNECFSAKIEDSIVYSDSKTDIPLLLWADKGIVVSKKNYRIWAKQYGFGEYLLSGKTIKNEKF